MIYLPTLLVLSRAADDASVEDLIRDLPRTRGRRRGFFSDIGNAITSGGNAVGDWGKEQAGHAGNAITHVGAGATTAWNGVNHAAGAVGGGIVHAIDTTDQWGQNAGQWGQDAGQWVGNTWDNAGLGHAVDTVGGWVQDAIDWLNPFDCETFAEFNSCKNAGTSNRNWMARIPDYKKITELSIPGTHDSAALHGGAAPWNVICNSLTIPQQLDAGIRYLDIRARHFNDQLPIHHGPVFQHESFAGVLLKVRQFLQQNPTETVFINLKEEYDAAGNTRSFNDMVQDVVRYELGRFGMLAPGYGQQPWELNMAKVRGKVVFIQAFSGNWLPGSIASESNLDYHGTVLQNDWKIDWAWQLDGKRAGIQQNLDQARGDAWRLYVNMLSGTGSSFGGIKQVAKPMNAHARNLMASRSTASGFGIIVADFPGANLITDIINKNPF